MPLPTLLRPGSIVSEVDKPNPENVIAIDYIMEFIGQRCSINGRKPKIPPNDPGDKVIVLRSGTGSGKSTTIAPELYIRFHDKVGRNIAITQPRVLTAIDIPRDIVGIPNFSKLKLEKNIGFQTGDFSRLPSEKGIIFMTIGILLNQLVTMDSEQFMNKYSFVIIDEVHERDLNNDATQFLLKKFLHDNWKNPSCPLLILMSATFEPSIFIEYYGCSNSQFIDVKGETFPIEEFYPKYDISDYISYAYEKAIAIHLGHPEDFPKDGANNIGDILVFIKGGKDGETLLGKFNHFNTEQYLNNGKLYISPILLTSETFHKGGSEYINTFSNLFYIKVPVTTESSFQPDQCKPELKDTLDTSLGNQHKPIQGAKPQVKPQEKEHKKGENPSTIPNSSQNKIIKVTPLRKIFIATNIAETGVTIETLKYCIDTGYYLSSEFNPDIGCNMLLSKNVTRGMAIQRRGRAGRKSPGNWFPCYTKEVFELLPKEQFSQILTSDITQILLNIVNREVGVQIVETPQFSQQEYDCGDIFRMCKISNPVWYKLEYDNKLDLSQLDFLESPSAGSIQYSIEKLHGLGFITSNYEVTLFGLLASKFQKISVESIRMILAGYCHGANILDLITIAAALFIDVTARNYQYRNPLNLNDTEALFYNKIMFCDEFVDRIFLWDEFSSEVDNIVKSADHNIIKGIQQWCETNSVNYYSMHKLINIRDEIIENMLEMGLNPYYNGLNLSAGTYNLTTILRQNLEDGLEEIRKIKKCILDGFRFNLLTSTKRGKYSLAYKQISININSNLVKPYKENQLELPKQVIVSSINLVSQRFDPSAYELTNRGLTSILDGFIDVDTKLLFN